MILKMGRVAQKTLEISLNGFVEDKDVSKDVRDLSEILVTTTGEVEEKAFELMVKYQPVASDLRIINSYIKVAYDFERFGRYGWDISFINEHFGEKSTCNQWILDYVRQMSEKVLQLVAVSINSLKGLDTELANSANIREQEVDSMYITFLDRLVTEASVTNECTISSVLIVRYLERIADHAMHIIEAVIYISTGDKITLR
jgi:phosphate transport system protein